MPEGFTEQDLARMDVALELAARGWGQVSPNPLVGAVVFSGDERISEGHHAAFGGPHAETVALERAGARASGATMYVNLEPCRHHGRNPPCTDAIIAAGISRVVVATLDPNPVAAGGASRLRDAGVRVDVGAREDEAREINAAFLHSLVDDRPWVTLKLALSLDGALAGAARRGGWLTSDRSRAMVQRMRAGNDAIAVGVQTAIADDPRLTARSDPPPRVAPLRIIFDRTARLPAESTLAKTARQVPTVLVTASGTQLPSGLESMGVEAIAAHGTREALGILRERGVMSILVEGGAGLAASFLADSLVDRLVVFRAPLVLGDGALNAFSGIAGHDIEHAPRFTLLESRALGDDVMSIYAPAPA